MGCCLSNYGAYDYSEDDEYVNVEEYNIFPDLKCQTYNSHILSRSHSDSCLLFPSFENFKEIEITDNTNLHYQDVQYGTKDNDIPYTENYRSNITKQQIKQTADQTNWKNQNKVTWKEISYSEKYYESMENTQEYGSRNDYNVSKEDNILSLAFSGKINGIDSSNQSYYLENVRNASCSSFETSVVKNKNSNNRLCIERTKESMLLAENASSGLPFTNLNYLSPITYLDDKSTQTEEIEFLKSFLYQPPLDTNFPDPGVVLGIPTRTYDLSLAGEQNLPSEREDGSKHPEPEDNNGSGPYVLIPSVLEKGLSLLVKSLF